MRPCDCLLNHYPTLSKEVLHSLIGGAKFIGLNDLWAKEDSQFGYCGLALLAKEHRRENRNDPLCRLSCLRIIPGKSVY